jgi:hypothetical protein
MFNASRNAVLSALFAAATVSLAIPSAQAQEGCNATTWPLTAGAGNDCTAGTDVGSVTVSSDATNIYVNYTLDYQNPACPDGAVDAVFGTLHVWIGSDLLDLPRAGNANDPQCQPSPGQFCQSATGQCFDATGLTSHTFVYSIAELAIADYFFCGQPLYVVTHAEVNYLDCTGVPDGTGDTAFGGDQPQCDTCDRWYFLGQFTPDCTDCGGGGNPICRTSYAKGGYVWTTSPKSNPEHLPSLNLTMNRWGWAIKLASIGTSTYEIWEGAGLNKTCYLNNRKAVLVGQLTLDWDGAMVNVRYDMFANAINCGGADTAGRTIEEVHVYAGDGAPATIAPGQYGFIDSFDPGVTTYQTTLPLADLDGTAGVWVIAHAVTCRP